MTPGGCQKAAGAVGGDHGQRRGWVWARLGMCPLAGALAHLAVLAQRTVTAPGGDSADAMAKLYAEGGYLADDAAVRALACVKTAEDVAAVRAAVRCVYLPWLDDTARNLQECLATKALPAVAQQEGIEAASGQCIVFADGLRFDTGKRLVAMAEARQLEVSDDWRWARLRCQQRQAGRVAGCRVRGGSLMPATPRDFRQRRGLGDRLRRLLSAAGLRCSDLPSRETHGQERPRVDGVWRVRQARMTFRRAGGTDRGPVELLLERATRSTPAGSVRS